MIAAAPKLRVIARAGTGVDNVDVAAASARGIVVMNAPGANSVSVAEHALALMLVARARDPDADAAMKRGVWDKKKLTGAELRGKTLGIVGLGRIGQEVAPARRSFGMEIVAHDPFISEQVAGTLGIELLVARRAVRARRLHHAAPSGDAGNPSPVQRASGWRKCKTGVRIVNTARGELIDETALAEAIEAGHVAGAGLDVFENEPPTDWRAGDTAAGHRDAAHRRVDRRSTGAGRPRDGGGGPRLPARRRHPQRGELSVGMPAESSTRVRPFMTLAERMGALVVADRRRPHARRSASGYYGPLVSAARGI